MKEISLIIDVINSQNLSKKELLQETLLAETRMNSGGKLRYHISEKDNQNTLIMINDNCNAFREWLDENKIPYLRTGHTTTFDMTKVDIFDVAKQYGIYEYLNKPKK